MRIGPDLESSDETFTPSGGDDTAATDTGDAPKKTGVFRGMAEGIASLVDKVKSAVGGKKKPKKTKRGAGAKKKTAAKARTAAKPKAKPKAKRAAAAKKPTKKKPAPAKRKARAKR